MAKHSIRTHRRAIGADFRAPDGGWGWCVVLAAGCSNLCTFPVLQQFGLLFRDRLTELGLSGKEITTIINLNSCVTSCLGLLNGPIFRMFSYRQVAFAGALLAGIGVLATSTAASFGTYVLTFSILYGAGNGINQSANALALNTYFRERRRIATGISWTATALGPIIFPQVISLLLPMYGVQGTVLLFGAIALNAVMLSLFYQPVEWHTVALNTTNVGDCDKKGGAENDDVVEDENVYSRNAGAGKLCRHCQHKLEPVDVAPIVSYSIVDPGTPMLSHANDGWFSATPAGRRSVYGSRMSLASRKPSSNNMMAGSASGAHLQPAYSRVHSVNNDDDNIGDMADVQRDTATPTPTATMDDGSVRSNRVSFANLTKNAKDAPSATKQPRDVKRSATIKTKVSNEPKIEETDAEDCPSFKAPQDLRDVDKMTKTGDTQQEERNSASRPMFIINDSFKKRKPRAAVSTNQQQTADEVPIGWLTVKSSLPSRQQSALSIFDMTPRRNFSTTSFQTGEREVLRNVRHKLEYYVAHPDDNVCSACGRNDDSAGDPTAEPPPESYTWWQRLCIFFDLDLLRDPSYVNLMVGVTMASFAELNYSILTPFVLADYGLTKVQTATSMSLLGLMDISVRFVVPFAAGWIGWENKTFFLVGVLGMALGRISIAHFHSYPAVLMASVWIGLNKGLRTVFMALVMPSYVPLERLPAATGLQLLFAGMFYFTVGPVIGWIRDSTNYTVTLHCLNIATFSTAICWTAESLYHRRRARKDTDTSMAEENA